MAPCTSCSCRWASRARSRGRWLPGWRCRASGPGSSAACPGRIRGVQAVTTPAWQRARTWNFVWLRCSSKIPQSRSISVRWLFCWFYRTGWGYFQISYRRELVAVSTVSTEHVICASRGLWVNVRWSKYRYKTADARCITSFGRCGMHLWHWIITCSMFPRPIRTLSKCLYCQFY